jgi:hypothetical protein
MTDTSPGPGWWLASDGRWYPPHLHPRSRPAGSDGPRPAADPPPSSAPAPAGAHATAPRPAAPTPSTPAPAPVRGPAGGIDWEAVARERAAVRDQRNRRESRRRHLAAVLAAAAVIVLGVLVAAIATGGGGDPDTRDTTGDTGDTRETATPAASGPAPTTAPAPASTAPPATVAASGATGTISVFSLQPGMCIEQEDLTRSLIMNVRTVPCTSPHTHEVYLRTTITPVDAPFDAAKVADFANKACTDGFTGYVGIPYEQSKYYYLHLAPSAESWNKSRDRDVVCLVLLEGQKLTSSVKGKGQ